MENLRVLVEILKEEQAIIRHRGRPRVHVNKEQLQYLIECRFRTRDIATLFGCSTRTIQRRMAEFGVCNAYTAATDAELDLFVYEVTSAYPLCGEKTILGRMRSQGTHVPRQRVRDSMLRVDPSGVESLKRRILHRRVYSVPSPNSLWHLDGYHKLIRWKIVIHGGIDGYSRLVIFLRAATNNRAATVLSAFQCAVEEFGLPSRIRTDRGGENVLVSQFMLEHPSRGTGRGSVIAGRSVHNQRIERLWRDLYSGCHSYFYNYFYYLEDIGVLSQTDLDIYALHITFLPLIQRQLDVFRIGWANHSLRTEGNHTPQQLWMLGLAGMREQDPEDEAVTGIEVSSI